MKKKRLNIVMTALAAVLVLCMGVGTAMAYFTSYALTDGTYPVRIRERTRITEEFSAWTKHVRITADDDSDPVYIRARAYHSDAYSVEYDDPEGAWEYRGDGFWYYKSILYAGGTTPELTVKINGVPEEITDPLAFGVAVIYESTPVRYDDAGNPYADWAQKTSYEAGKEDGAK